MPRSKARDVRLAHRQRRPHGLHRAEAVTAPLGLLEHRQVDLDGEDLLHAADVPAAELLVRVDERARALDAGRRVHDLVAVDIASPALDFALWMERQRFAGDAEEMSIGRIVGTSGGLRKT